MTVYRAALPEPNEENQNIYYAFFFFAKNSLILFGDILNIVVCLITGVAHFPFMGLTNIFFLNVKHIIIFTGRPLF